MCVGCRLGQVNSARKHLCFLGKASDHMELKKLEGVEKHLNKCVDARRIGDWKTVLMEVDAAIVSGADFSPQVKDYSSYVRLDRMRMRIKIKCCFNLLCLEFTASYV